MTEKDDTYNGWTNYETWAVKLWIDNEQGTQEYWREQARECVSEGLRNDGENAPNPGQQRARYLLADRLKDQHEEAAHLEIKTGVFADLLRAAVSDVNWDEIAAHLADDNNLEELNAEEATA